MITRSAITTFLALSLATVLQAQDTAFRMLQVGGGKLIAYSDVPGGTPSEFYRIRVRSEASKGVWQPVFARAEKAINA